MGDAKDLAGTKVMIIDDSNTIRRSAEIFLGQSGCELILATDGFDALAKIVDYHPDIIFIDIIMPRLDGYQTCMLIKKILNINLFRLSCYQAKKDCLIAHAAELRDQMTT